MSKFSLSIQWIFIIITLILVGSILISNYYISLNFYKTSLERNISNVTSLFKAEVENFISPVENFLYNIQALVCCQILDFKDIEKTNRFLIDFMKKHPQVTSINYGDSKGNGYLILNDRGKWLNRIKKAEEKGFVVWNTLDNEGKILGKKIIKDNYDPRKTEWYRQALLSNDIQWSKEYLFRTTKDPGITASLLLCSEEKKVVGVDIMIKDISMFLNKTKQKIHDMARLYLISDGLDIIAFSNDITAIPGKLYQLNETEFPLLYKALGIKGNNNLYKIDFEGQKWLVKTEKWHIKNKELTLVNLLPYSVLTKNLNTYLFYQIMATLIISMITIIYVNKKYIKPLINISEQASNLGLKELNFTKESQRTDEIGHLSRAISDASKKILESKEIERKIQETQKFECIKRSLGEMVHRFKDLINVIQGFASIAHPKVSDPFIKNALDQIINASKRAIYLSKEILTLTGEREYDMKESDLNKVILSMKTTIKVLVGEKITVIYELLEDSLKVNIDIKAFEEIMTNLISNAKEAMPEGGIIKIKTEKISVQEKQYALLSVSDTGTGIDDEIKQRIFDPFFTTKGAKGTGLGLSIVYIIVNDHKGYIEVESELGKGTTFKIYLPITDTYLSSN